MRKLKKLGNGEILEAVGKTPRGARGVLDLGAVVQAALSEHAAVTIQLGSDIQELGQVGASLGERLLGNQETFVRRWEIAREGARSLDDSAAKLEASAGGFFSTVSSLGENFPLLAEKIGNVSDLHLFRRSALQLAEAAPKALEQVAELRETLDNPVLHSFQCDVGAAFDRATRSCDSIIRDLEAVVRLGGEVAKICDERLTVVEAKCALVN